MAIKTDFSVQGNAFVVYRNNVRMAAFHMDWMAILYCNALIERHVSRGYGTAIESESELEIRTEYHPSLIW